MLRSTLGPRQCYSIFFMELVSAPVGVVVVVEVVYVVILPLFSVMFLNIKYCIMLVTSQIIFMIGQPAFNKIIHSI